MKAAAFDVPVAIFAFNRPKLTRRVFDAVAERRPKRLFLVADGPRPDRSEDNVPCEEVRKILMDVSWPCEVATNFSDGNLGCGRRISSGINWLFKHVDAAILIEDDCLPAPSFFDFCSTVLSRFANDSRIGLVSGSNFTWRHFQPSASYYFSRYTHIWGWATWRRSWAHYDFGLRSLSLAREHRLLEEVFDDPQLADFWYTIFEAVKSGRIDTWDYQLFYASVINSWLNVIPAVNLVTKSGSNQMHGDVFEFIRNWRFNARNFFAPTRDSLNRNQFGGTMGAPIVKNKLFFFGGYQGTKQRSAPTQLTAYVPTPAMLAGDF